MKARFAQTYGPWHTNRDQQCLSNLLKMMAMSAMVCCLMLLLSGCAKTPAKSGAGVNTAEPSETRIVQSPLASPTPTFKPPLITLQVLGCPNGFSLNWDGLVGTKAGVNKVQTVTCGSLEGSGSFDALINVRYYTPDARLDYYVYDNLNGSPHRSFSMQGMVNGDAQISPNGTLITAEIGSGDSIQGARDVFKEYGWNGATFQQMLFSGIYPDMTYYQAEQDQTRLNAELAAGDKRDAWKTSFSGVANNLAKKIFHWTSTHFSLVQFSNHDGIYIGSVTNLGPGGGGFVASMFHLDNNLNNMYIIKQVTSLDGSTALTSPAIGVQLSSPISISGTALTSGGILGKVVVYSDSFIALGDSGNILSHSGGGYVNFSKSVMYHLNSTGLQEGLVAFFATTQNNTFLSNQVVMVKVFLKA
jgi:hypothetical protein